MSIRDSQAAVLLLAGGEGKRIGGMKPLRRLGGATLIERAGAKATSWSPRVAIAVRDPEQVGAVPFTTICDTGGIGGPLGGLAAGLEWAMSAGATRLLTLPCDMPFAPSDLPDRLAAGLTPAVKAVVAASGDHLHPVCGLWRIEAARELAHYLASGRRSLKGFAEAVGCAVICWPPLPVDPFFNVNTPEDLAAAEALVRAGADSEF